MHFRPNYMVGTTSGGSSEDDRSEKSGGGSIGAEHGDLALYPFRINVVNIDKKQSPLFEHFPGQVKVLLPYFGADQPGIGINDVASVESLRVYLSELTFLFNDNTGHQNVVKPVTGQDRVHIFLAQSALAPDENDKGTFTLPKDSGESYDHVIHDFRPINRIISRKFQVGKEQENISEAYPSASAVYLVITRSVSTQLKPKDNLYTAGIVDFSLQNPPMPQLYQRVKVWVDEGTETNNKVKKVPKNQIDIWDALEDKPRAVLRIAANIQPVYDKDSLPDFTID